MDHGLEHYRRFLSGEDESLVEIIDLYRAGLILFINGIVNDLYAAEELTEDTFVKLVVKRPHFRGDSAFKTWLYSIAKNIAQDYLRRSKKQPISLEELVHLPSEEETLERSYLQQEERIAVFRAMKALKPAYRQVLHLTYFEGLSNKEIARILGKTTHNVETMAYRARAALKNILIKEGFCYEDK